MSLNFKMCVLVLLMFLSMDVFSQVRLNKIIQENEYNSIQKNQLIVAEFWATWCVPCIFASKQLAILQEKFKDEIYIFSISGESTELIERHLIRHGSKLTVASDFDNLTSKNFNPQNVVPYTVIFNQKNDVIWKGNPLELNEKILRELISKSAKITPLSLEDRVFIKSYNLELNGWHPEVFDFSLLDEETNSIERSEGGLDFRGKLSDFLSDFLQVDKSFIISKYDPYVHGKVSNEILSNCDVEFKLNMIPEILNIELVFKQKDFYSASLSDISLLWHTDRINWGNTTNLVLETDQELTINNATIHQFGIQLGKYLNKPIVFNESNCELFDWQVPVKYSNLMRDELKYTYGMELVEKNGTVLMYEVSVNQ